MRSEMHKDLVISLSFWRGGTGTWGIREFPLNAQTFPRRPLVILAFTTLTWGDAEWNLITVV